MQKKTGRISKDCEPHFGARALPDCGMTLMNRRKIQSHLTVSQLAKLDVDYDETGDVLYISFGAPVTASDSRVLDNDIVVRFRGERIAGVPVPSFSKRRKQD